VLRDLTGSQKLVVFNDEAHHCYRGKADDEKRAGADRAEAKERNEEARAWQTGLQAIRRVVGVKTVYDLSATPATRTRRRPGQRHLKWRWAEAVPHRTAAVTGSSAQTLLPFSVGLIPHARLMDATRNRP